MGEPPLSGAVHKTTTLSGLQTVLGALGCAGGYAVRTLIVEEKTEKP